MDLICSDYDNFLIGRASEIGQHNFSGSEPGGTNQQKALLCIRYCIENILKWTTEEAVIGFDEYMIRLMKLDRMVRYIKWPADIVYGSPRYILSLLYPEKVRLNRDVMMESMYKEVLSGRKHFPRDYFIGIEGFYRFCACLRYLIENYQYFGSLDEIYRYFLSPEGNQFLCDFKLKVPTIQFGLNIVDCIYYISSNYENSELLYQYYRFQQQFRQAVCA